MYDTYCVLLLLHWACSLFHCFPVADEENGDIVKSRRTARERPMSFSKMEDVKSRWETGSAAKKEERREERKQEIQSIRSRLFMVGSL